MAIDKKKKISLELMDNNPWLKSPEKGLSLIASLLARPDCSLAKAPGLDEMRSACDRLARPDLEENFADMQQIINLFQLPGRTRLLRNTAIVGFGGGFSSGKSSVLNSLLGESKFKLPVDSNPTTSISTYIMEGPTEKAIVCSTTGRETPLDPEGLEAISHQFREKHKINLAQFIEFVGVVLPKFPASGVALLDTPGYNKNDNATLQEHRDRLRSQEALSSVDHLVWVIDANQPVLTDTDIKFIKDLDLAGELTVILNKCDNYHDIYNSAKPEDNERISSIKRNLAEKAISYTSIIPYSANEPDWNNGRAKVIAFLQKIATGKKSAQERISQIEGIIKQIQTNFNSALNYYHWDEIARIDKCLAASHNPLELGALAQTRGLMGFERSSFAHAGKIFEANAARLLKWTRRQMEASGE